MELKTYLSILLKKWWIVVPVFLVTLITAVVITYTKTPVYSASATFVVAPSPLFSDVGSYASGLNILSNREQIVATYTEVAASATVRNMAAEAIGLEATRGYAISSNVFKGTNVIQITAQGPDPTVVRDLANAVGNTAMEYARGLYEIYTISPLDEAQLPRSPISPNRMFDISIAAVLGLVLGGSVAFLVSYLEPSPESVVNINIIDGQTGAYNKQYFLQRLGEEMVRAKRNRYPLSVALMHIDNLHMLRGFNAARVRGEALHHVVVLLKQHLKEEDLVAYLGENTFAFLMPDTPGKQAQAVMEYLQARIVWAPFQSKVTEAKLTLDGAVGVATYNHNGAGRDQLMEIATQALQLAEVSEDGKVYLKAETDA